MSGVMVAQRMGQALAVQYASASVAAVPCESCDQQVHT